MDKNNALIPLLAIDIYEYMYAYISNIHIFFSLYIYKYVKTNFI